MQSHTHGTSAVGVSPRFRNADAWHVCIMQVLILLVAFALVASLPAFGQGIVTGSLSGTVVDPTGAVVTGAKITATHLGTTQVFTTTTNNVGYFAIRAVPIGTYKVVVETTNFQKLEMAGVEVAVGKETALGSMKLSLARGMEVIEVQEAAPLMETTTSQISTTFTTKPVAQLPLAGGFDALALYIPGVANSGDNSFSNTNGADISSNGLRSRNNNFQIDGQNNNDNSVAGPSIFMGNEEAIGEVNIITNNFGVEYGRNSGSVVNYITKSGTNALHGSLFEYNNNSIWQSHSSTERSTVYGYCRPGVAVGTLTDVAGNPDPNGTACKQPAHPAKYIDNRYGGSLGGPIVRNKVWFFGSYMEEKERTAGAPSPSGTSITPTPSGLATLAAAFPGNAGVAALQTIGPYAVLKGGPQPIGTPSMHTVSNGLTTANVQFQPMVRNVPSYYNDWELVGKVDAQVTNKDRLGFRYIFQKNVNSVYATRVAAGGWFSIPGKDQQFALDWVRTISNTIVNQARFSYSRAQFGWERGAWDSCTFATINACPTNIGLAGTNLSFGPASNMPQGRLINVTQWQDNASWVHGRHTFKFGGEYARQRSPNTFLPNLNGVYTFSGATTAQGTPGTSSYIPACATSFPGISVNSTDCSFSRLLANQVASLQLADGPPKSTFREQDMAFYGGDDWRIRDNLTLNLGLRWEFATQAFNLLHEQTVANMQGSNPLWNPTLPASVTTFPAVPNVYTYFAPNVGFAWTPKGRIFGDGKTVIRGGARIAYDPAFYNMFINAASAAPVVNLTSLVGTNCTAPCLPTSGFTGSDVRALHLSQLARGGNPGASNNTTVAPDFHESRTYLWSFGIEREITKQVAFESRYVGNHATGLYQTINANPALAGLITNGFSSFIPAGVTPCADATLPNGLPAPGFASGRPDCYHTNLRVRENTSWSYYHGWQNQLRVNSWHGVTTGISYTWSKTMDNASEIFSNWGGGTANAGAQNPYDWSNAEKGESGISFPHTASIYFIYELPFFKSQKGFIAHLLGGYGFNTMWRYSSGQLWTPLVMVGGSTSCQNSYDTAFFSGSGYPMSTCRPFVGNPSAPLDMVGQCTDVTAADCGLVDFYTGSPIAKSAVRFIYNDDTAAAFFGTPYGNARRNSMNMRGDTTNNVTLGLSKNTKIAERVTMRLEAQVFNLLNRDFRGVPDTWLDDGNWANGSSYGNTYWNSTGYGWSGGGLGRRRMILGAKFTF